MLKHWFALKLIELPGCPRSLLFFDFLIKILVLFVYLLVQQDSVILQPVNALC